MGGKLGPEAGGSPFQVQRICRYLSEWSPRPTVVVEGESHVVIYLNPAFALLVGKAKGSLMGRPFAEAVPEGTGNGCLALLDRVFHTGRPEDLVEQEHRQPDSHPVFWSYAVWAVLGEDDRPAGVLIQVTDSTEIALFRRQAAEVNEALVVSAASQHELADEARKGRDHLEERVAERTADLSRALALVEQEGAERRRTEQARLELLRRVVDVQEEERARISRELHDQMGQHLAALAMELQILRDAFDESAVSVGRLGRLQETTAQVGVALHRLAFELRPPLLDDLGLEAAVRDNLEEWSRRSGVAFDFCGSGFNGARVGTQVETTVYRIFQEALTNISKHARAANVYVVLENRGGSLQLTIEDDGRGFDLEAVLGSPDARRRLGLIGMEERVSMVGGTLVVESRPGGPTTLYVRIPAHTEGGGDRR
ncbi:sensor histidine kinase [Paludisphaera soli]|uniref:sensor histidine kinase n=1 Tax=Paludisphaera soli TaxID=2712865 RepID=UPI0013EB1F08|nr:ATP-binding protein [Paludisphaera soli]